MHDESNPRRRDHDADTMQGLVLELLLDLEAHGPWNVQELAREFGSEVLAVDTVTALHASGLVHLCHELVFPTRPAARCFRLARGAVRMDHLEPLLGCRRTVQRTVARLRDRRLAVTRRLLVGEPAWLLPTPTGLRACGSSFRVWQPRLGLIEHVAAVNEVRLHVHERSPEAEWICERRLAREREAGEHLPDALVLRDGQRIAIEVELTVKSRKRTTQILD
jgi:hypothetical protein